jgi:hypothetical protein
MKIKDIPHIPPSGYHIKESELEADIRLSNGHVFTAISRDREWIAFGVMVNAFDDDHRLIVRDRYEKSRK